jgi:Family of unknown function (DUF6262)
MSTTTAHETRTAALRAARAKDSARKRQRALTAIEALEAAGSPITFTAVANAAAVSTWLVYAEGIREHVDAARQRQADHETPRPCRLPDNQRATPDSVRTDLAIARQEIARLRAERDKLAQRLRLQLGAEIEGPDRLQLIARVGDLETVNRQLVAERDALAADAATATRRIGDLEDDLTAARESLRRVIKDQNRGH